eukprot:TRINITY_DN4569_c0_g1_i1.p1 TRINITY_DN4569_c0_g1~~TRINITY_DN4569_c0_g1_i1.p1  ORF type:complete len:178 (-),score=40.39 TRINITY_DN4569_c0_g1_i1:27-560(-)
MRRILDEEERVWELVMQSETSGYDAFQAVNGDDELLFSDEFGNGGVGEVSRENGDSFLNEIQYSLDALPRDDPILLEDFDQEPDFGLIDLDDGYIEYGYGSLGDDDLNFGDEPEDFGHMESFFRQFIDDESESGFSNGEGIFEEPDYESYEIRKAYIDRLPTIKYKKEKVPTAWPLV